MGWGSATHLFDGAVDVALDFAPDQPVVVRAVVDRMYTCIDWGDWDTQNESRYYDEHLIHVMLARGEIDVEDYDEHMKMVREREEFAKPNHLPFDF